MATILLAEDDARQAEAVRRFLRSDDHQVRVVGDGVTALDDVRRLRPDLVILDVMLPGLDGVEVCQRLRQESTVPVLMLTARVEERDLLTGLSAGADDYLTKPYSPRELLARVGALLRRVHHEQAATAGTVLAVDDLVVDRATRAVTLDGAEVVCTRDEFDILAALAEVPGRVLSRRQLLDRTGGAERASAPRAIDTHVTNLRRKLEADPRRPQRLLSVYAVGYKLARHSPTPALPER